EEMIIPFDAVPTICTDLLNRLVSRGWQPMRNCPNWVPDSASWQQMSIPSSVRRIAERAYERLSTQQQEAFDELVHGYQKRGWWIARTEEELQQLSRSTRILPPSVVFMIPGTNRRRDRLAVDQRRANRSFTRGSSSSVAVSICIAAARLYGAAPMWVMDCSRAFCKLRWVGLLALLVVRSELFTSDRCVCGVTTGPGSLGHTLGELIAVLRTLCAATLLCFLLLCF
ncbi:hypothetical protein FOZ63_016573, partial [Perkinsus olseni]